MNILGIQTGHDGASALFMGNRLVAYSKEERLTREKGDGTRRRHPGRVLLMSIDEVLNIAGIESRQVDMVVFSRMSFPLKYFRRTSRPGRNIFRRMLGKSCGLAVEMRRLQERDEGRLLNFDRLRRDLGLRSDTDILFANHHYSHILAALQYTTWKSEALLISSDGGGDGIVQSAYGFDGERLHLLYGGDDYLLRETGNRYAASVGHAYQFVTEILGFRPNRHEGKITGLAAFGKPVFGEDIRNSFQVSESGEIGSRFADHGELYRFLEELSRQATREEMASSIQYAAERVTLDWIRALLKRFPAKYIGMSGGVFSNVRLNQHVAELPGIEEVFIVPPMGDEGLPVGNCIHGVIEREGLAALPRYRLQDAYFSRVYSSDALFAEAGGRGFHVHSSDNPADEAARLLADGYIGAIYTQGMEMGPRALGARSIIASPDDRGLNDSLNQRLGRTEFMPFAPYVLDVDAERVFKVNDVNRYACRFMTITTDVHEAYQEKIPAVVHIDGTARPQIVERETNPLYYDILDRFKIHSGLPCLVNTSFNAHEEPIINTPAEAVQALGDHRIDFLVSDGGLVFRGNEPEIIAKLT